MYVCLLWGGSAVKLSVKPSQIRQTNSDSLFKFVTSTTHVTASAQFVLHHLCARGHSGHK